VFAGKTKSFIFFIQNSIFQSNFDLKTPRKEHKHLENPINDLKKQKKKNNARTRN
jgi:cob(I)alamin adenosyltransferase